MKNEIEQLKKEFNERIDALLKKSCDKQQGTKFEVGKWYTTGEWLAKFERIGSYNYGCEINGDFFMDTIHMSQPEDWRLATKEEVEQALIAEAKRKYKKGEKIKSIKYPNKTKKLEFEHLEYHDVYFNEKDILYIDGYDVYKQGKWAEIIKDDKIEIGGYEVCFCTKRQSQFGAMDKYTTIDGYDFSKEFWKSAKRVAEHSKACVMVGCSHQFKVSLETINKILDKL